jgi:hypothetical protein
MSFRSSNSPSVIVLESAGSIPDNVFASISDDSQSSSNDQINQVNRIFKLKYLATFSVTLRSQRTGAYQEVKLRIGPTC